jgi:hypothetical protein
VQYCWRALEYKEGKLAHWRIPASVRGCGLESMLGEIILFFICYSVGAGTPKINESEAIIDGANVDLMQRHILRPTKLVK